ncbi:beta/gamma crystallin domain-containing protein 1-like isoform X2 [Archocentrus centrarchus]|uniref:beta/gamma crystallin domain-containing protein 1-like isoform X2 n=1 Tax=Archocentrus centrarchus TaxID=63155 RepID=UPI0011E9EEEF|nr:beta/gamma crystallin domain-containing protein 1-like isoform X2 [Archocentrus centrarchus]
MSESPEDQPSTGVLGRIGSWLSPWRGKALKSPAENALPTSDHALKPEGEVESEESVRLQAGAQQREQENPHLQSVFRGIFPCEEEDATQSAHRDGPVVCSTERGVGGSRKEELGECSRQTTGQGKEREESSKCTSASGNPERNDSHLTHPYSSPKQGVAWDSDQAHAQAQAQTGKRLHVYLEETSVIQCGQNICAGQEVVRTRLQVVPKAKSSPSSNLQNSSSAENKGTNARPAAGTQDYYSALVEVPLKSHKDSQSDPEPVREQIEEDSMGRKNSARRRSRKNSQGDGGNTPVEKNPPNAQPGPEEFPESDNSASSPKSKSQAPADSSSSKQNPTSQASPQGGEKKTSCPDTVKQLDNLQEKRADMEEDDAFYTVERKTETPESKRRSIKVSQSEVKFFSKYVPLNPKQSPAEDNKDCNAALKNTKGEAKDTPKTENDARVHTPKKADEERKPAVGSIADKISLFEQQQQSSGNHKQTFRTPRSADVSPNRKPTEALKTDFLVSDQRSRSAERYDTERPSSLSPVTETPMTIKTIKERMRKFAEASASEAKPAQPPTPALKGMSHKSTSSVAVSTSKSPELDSQGKLDTKELIQTKAVSNIALKLEGQDVAPIGEQTSSPVVQGPKQDSKTKEPVISKAIDQGTKPNSVETEPPAEELGDSTEATNNISPPPKGPNRTGSRSKRRKSKEPTSPISPSTQNTPECFTSKSKVTATKQEKGDDTNETASAPEQLAEKVPSHTIQRQKSDEQALNDNKQKEFKKEVEVSDKQKKQLDVSLKKKKIHQPGLLQPSVSKDEPDTAACSSGTKMPLDKDSIDLPQKEEEAEGQSLAFKMERKKASAESAEPLAFSSPLVDQTIEKPSAVQQETLVEDPKLDKELSMQLESKGKGKRKKPSKKEMNQTQQSQNKDIDLISHAEPIDVERLQKLVSEKTNQTEEKVDKKPLQLLPSDECTTKTKVLHSVQAITAKEESVARDDERKNAEKNEETQPLKDIIRPEAKDPEPASQSSEKSSGSSDLPAPMQDLSQAVTTPPEKAAVCTITHSNEAVSGSKSDTELGKIETVINGPSELQTHSAESLRTETAPVVIAQPNSASVEKTENSLDDSCTHGANDAKLSSPNPITKATAATEEVNARVTNDTLLLHTDLTHEEKKESPVEEPSPISVCKAANTKGGKKEDGEKSSTVKSVPSEVSSLGDIMKLDPSHTLFEESKNIQSASDIPSLREAENVTQSPPDSAAASSTVTVIDKSAVTALNLPVNELSSHTKSDISPHSKVQPVKKKPVDNNLSQSPKAPTSPESNRQIPGSIHHSSMKKLHLPLGLSKDDSSKHQDAPSSWLDVDFPKRKLKVQEQKLTSSGSESNLLDTPGELDDDDFVERIKKLCAPFSLPPRKHNHLRPPQPPFAMPAIREDRFEKTFDPEEFTFGLRKKTQFTLDTSKSLLSKHPNTDTKSGLKPARASFADRSMLLNSLDTHSRLRDKTPGKEEEDMKEEKDDQIKVKSRLEGSCVFSSLSSSLNRGTRNGVQAQTEGTGSGNVSPTKTSELSPPPSSQSPLPSSPVTASIKDTLAKQSEEEARAAEAVVSDSGPPLPSFNDIKLPDYLEKYLPKDQAKPVQSIQGQDQVKTELIGKMTTPVAGDETDSVVKPGPVLPDTVAPCLPVVPPTTQPTLPKLKQPRAQPQGVLRNSIRTVKGFHKRPGKMVLFEKPQFSGQAHEIYRDVADATSLQLSPLISVKVVRGCWVLYEKPNFQGRIIALEEGSTELVNEWAEPQVGTEPHSSPPVLIGSIRLAVRDYSIPHIDLFTEPEGHGRVTPYHDDTIETGSFGIPLSTGSIQVHSGVWLIFSDPGFQGMVAVLETGAYPFPETWGFPSPFVGSLKPLKMGGFKVENPNEVKAVVYEKPGFEGSCMEIDGEIFSFCESEEDTGADGTNLDTTKLNSVGSLKITGGFWVGYSEPGFEGQQHILEEGEYLDCSEWGGSELLSLRPVLSDFMSPHLKMFSDKDFGKLGMNIDLTVPVINMDDTGYSMKTQSIDVIGGVWVVFEEPGFCGESYVLEKGLYGSPEDWGALQHRVGSTMPILLDDFENTSKFKVQLFSDPGFKGSVLTLEDSVASLQDGFSVASCKVLAGSWLAFEGQDFTRKMYVLEVGSYPDLRSMGCVSASSSILSLQTVGFEFSLPSITLFERCSLRGKRVVLTDGSVNLQLAGGCARVQSVLVEGGLWVLYEGINYRGAQILLKPGEVLDWRKFSSWQKIGSLRPLIQKQVHFHLRNRQTGLMMSVTGEFDDVKLLRIQETEETGGLEQIWFYQKGHLHCKGLEEYCLSPSGSVTMAGSRVGLTPAPDDQIHLWSITPEGFIRYTPTADLVLEVKGGQLYDKNQVILNTFDQSKLQQMWDVEII